MTSSPAEQANTVLKMTVKALRHVSLNPCTVGRIVEVLHAPVANRKHEAHQWREPVQRAETVVQSQHPVTPAPTVGQM
jgi:hypothetical protein